MRTCVIFNPTAKGARACRLRRSLDVLRGSCVLKPTQAAGAGRSLAAEAVHAGFEAIVAAGGDGTVNEVLNGIADVPEGLRRTRLGVLPVGTMNVFAAELGLPARLEDCWQVILRGRERGLDLVEADYATSLGREHRFCIQLAGVGLDARAVELVSWQQKKKLGFWAYVIAAFKALREPRPTIRVSCDGQSRDAESIIIGNGRFYASHLPFFPQAQIDDGRFDVCLYRRTDWLALVACLSRVIMRQIQPKFAVDYFQASNLELSAARPVPLELDGELAGFTPAVFSIRPKAIRVLVP